MVPTRQRRLAPCAEPAAYAEVRHFRGVTQRSSSLCWAACVQARIAMDRGGKIAVVDQVALAHRFVAPATHGGTTACQHGDARQRFDRPLAPQRMASVWHAVGYPRARWLPLPVANLGELLRAQLRRDRPVQVRLAGAHAVLVTAYLRAADGAQAVYIMDPAPERPSGWRPLDASADGWLDLWVDLAA